MKKNGFTLPELLAVIAVLSIILAIAVPKVLNYYSNSRESLFLTSAKGIVRDVDYNNIDLKSFKASRLIDLEIKDSNLYDLENSYMYVENNQLVLNLVGKGKYEGMYACGVTDSSVDNKVTNEPCDSINENEEVRLTVYLSDGVTNQAFNEKYESNSELVLEEPTRTDYKFKEWVVIAGDATITGNKLKFGVKDTSIYVRWDKTMVLTINLDGGSVSPTQDGTYMSNTTIQLNSPTKNGYTFDKWDLEKGNSILSGNTLIAGTQNTNLKALYNLNTYTISYTLNGGSATNPTSYNVESDTITLNNPTRLGYTFAGWTGSNGSTKQTTVTIPKGSTGNKTYTANWTGNSITCAAGQYLRASDASCQACPGGGVFCPGGTFTYNGNDQGKSNCPSGYTKSDASASTNTGCYISVAAGKYKTTSTGSTTANCAVGSYSVAHNSYYNATDSCSVCTPSGATGANGTTSAAGQSSCNASCNKSNVASWNTTTWNNNSPTNVCSPKTCATGYEVKDNACSLVTYTISYTLNSGTVATANPTSYNVTSNAITLNNPTRVGYTFKGWSGTGLTGDTNKTVTIAKGSTGNRSYTANWTANSITCDAGKYLRASDASCQNCPGGGVFCPGGTFTYNGSDQGKSNCPSGYTKSDTSASANTKCYIEVAAGKYKTTKTGSTTANCAAGTYKAKHNSYYNSADSCSNCTGRTKYSAAGAASCSTVSSGYYTTGCTGNDKCTGQTQCAAGNYCVNGVSTACAKGSYTNAKGKTACTACQPSGAAGANGTTSGTGQTSCNASCGKSNVSTWNTASWSANSVSNLCSIKTCASRYTLKDNTCSGGGYVSCFIAGTEVLTEDGYKNIEDIEVGEKVLSHNDETGITEYKTVEKTFVHDDNTEYIYKIKIGKDVIEATGNHPFYVYGKYVEAKNLKVGDKLLRSNGKFEEIKEITYYESNALVYNIKVEDNHNYYVGEGYLVHNKGGGSECWQDSTCGCSSAGVWAC